MYTNPLFAFACKSYALRSYCGIISIGICIYCFCIIGVCKYILLMLPVMYCSPGVVSTLFHMVFDIVRSVVRTVNSSG